MNARILTVCVSSMCLVCGGTPGRAEPYRPALPGSPASLTDWRWLARPLAGEHAVVADLRAKRKLDKAPDGRFVLVALAGPGVLDHLMSMDGRPVLAIEVDGRLLWKGTFGEMMAAGANKPALVPKPLVCHGASMRHLVAPVGFRTRLRVTTDKPVCSHYLSYRILPAGTPVQPATPDGAYAAGLRQAAQVWRRMGKTSGAPTRATPHRRGFVLHAKRRVTVLAREGSGEVTHLEFHVSPALSGSLREVLIEVFYDGQAKPALRMPLTDFIGTPHPWGTNTTTLAAGLRQPWMIHKPRVYYPELTLYSNLPMPFASGLRIDLVNRSPDVRFAGFVLAELEPLDEKQALGAGRLCGTRRMAPVTPGATPQPLLRVPGPGQLVGLGLYLTGSATFPTAARTSMMSLALDDRAPILGHGPLPLWFAAHYGGPYGSPLWSHPRMEEQFCGVVRHFITDPYPFAQAATFGYTPGPPSAGMPTGATVLALWYRFGGTPFAAPPLAARAERLPFARYPGNGVGRHSRMAWCMEAEDLARLAVAHGGEVRVIEDTDHNYHPSAGKYLHVAADRAGDYVDCVVPFPPSRYIAVGTGVLYGPNRASYELDVLSKAQARMPPGFSHDLATIRGRAIGGVRMRAPIHVGNSLVHRRDGATRYSLPFLNPAPDRDGVVRFICQAKPLGTSTYQMKLDQLRMEMPPAPPAGWREFEDEALPEARAGLVAQLPKHGRFTWSGWGALALASPKDGQAVIRALALAGPRAPTRMRLKGNLGPEQGAWAARVNGGPIVPLTPGKDANQLVVWTIPVEGVDLPGTITIEVLCTASAEKTPKMRQAPHARLVLDCWAMR